MWYAPRPQALLADTDLIDGIAGWEEYVIVEACIKAKTKQEDDVSVFMAQKQELLKRIEDAAENRDIGDPETVSDSKTRNFAWGDTGGGGTGNGWW
jgi:dsDNA-binding SOS-regulon protein